MSGNARLSCLRPSIRAKRAPYQNLDRSSSLLATDYARDTAGPRGLTGIRIALRYEAVTWALGGREGDRRTSSTDHDLRGHAAGPIQEAYAAIPEPADDVPHRCGRTLRRRTVHLLNLGLFSLSCGERSDIGALPCIEIGDMKPNVDNPESKADAGAVVPIDGGLAVNDVFSPLMV